MKLVHAETPARLARPRLYPSLLLYASLITLCTTAQLFTLDRLYEHPIFMQPVGAILLPAMILIAVFSLPALLQLSTSRLMNILSFLCSIFLPILWIFFAYYTNSTSNEIGLLGTHFTHPAITWGIALACLGLTLLSILALGAPRLKK